MFSITDDMIESIVTNNQVIKRGLEYYRENRVVDLQFCDQSLCASAIVLGSEPYEVEVCFSPAGEINDAFCDCPAFYRYDGACKHIVALLKACRHAGERRTGIIKPESRSDNTRLVDSILEYFEYSFNSPEKKPVNLEITFEMFYEVKNFVQQAIPAISLRMGEDKLYVVKSVKKLFEAIETGKTLFLANSLYLTRSFIHSGLRTSLSLIYYVKCMK